MGIVMEDRTTLDLIGQLNARFGTGAAIIELVALHNEFQIFTPGRNLRGLCALIGLQPIDDAERRKWHLFLDVLKTYPSDRPGVNGHDRIVAAYVENFQDPHPLPIFTQVHLAQDDPRVLITTGYPIVFSQEQHLIKSIPVTPAGQASGRQPGTGSP
jgi:hypothetical protein